jgi:hypothetical protein
MFLWITLLTAPVRRLGTLVNQGFCWLAQKNSKSKMINEINNLLKIRILRFGLQMAW